MEIRSKLAQVTKSIGKHYEQYLLSRRQVMKNLECT